MPWDFRHLSHQKGRIFQGRILIIHINLASFLETGRPLGFLVGAIDYVIPLQLIRGKHLGVQQSVGVSLLLLWGHRRILAQVIRVLELASNWNHIWHDVVYWMAVWVVSFECWFTIVRLASAPLLLLEAVLIYYLIRKPWRRWGDAVYVSQVRLVLHWILLVVGTILADHRLHEVAIGCCRRVHVHRLHAFIHSSSLLDAGRTHQFTTIFI